MNLHVWPAINLGVVVGGTYVLPHLMRRIQEGLASKRCCERRSLVLTYDDGPSASLTPRLLDLLDHTAAPATFFLLGRQVRGNEAILDRMVASGHELACHGQDHLNAWKTSPWRATGDVRRGYQTLAPWVASDGLFRPPYGKMILPTWWAIRCRGARLGWWTIDSEDTHAVLPAPQSVADRVARAGGGVVLVHDFERGPERARFVLETTRLLLETAKREGLRVCRCSDLWQRTRQTADAPATVPAARSL
jgi:peptidoglycan/xylan/chitin deacetylase (PgdA/CDA1 family)